MGTMSEAGCKAVAAVVVVTKNVELRAVVGGKHVKFIKKR